MENIGEVLRKWTSNPNFQKKYEEAIHKVLEDEDVRSFLDAHSISEVQLRKSYAKLREFVKEKNARKQGLEVKNPDMEPVLVFHQQFIDVAYKPTQQYLLTQQEKQVQSRIHAFNMPKQIQQAAFEDFEITTERAGAFEKLVTFSNQFCQHPHQFHKGTYVVGNFGVGKTYLLGALANRLAQKGYHSTLVHVPSWSVEMKQAIADNSVMEKIDSIKTAPILMLDDIGAETNTAWFRDEVLGVVLQHRMLQELPTFFTSNFTMNELEEHFEITKNGEESLKAKRLMERVRFLADEVKMHGENRRMPGK